MVDMFYFRKPKHIKKITTTKQQLCSGACAKILQVEILLLFCSHVASHFYSHEHKSQWHPSEQQCDIKLASGITLVSTTVSKVAKHKFPVLTALVDMNTSRWTN